MFQAKRTVCAFSWPGEGWVQHQCSHLPAGRIKQSSGGCLRWMCPWLWLGRSPWKRHLYGKFSERRICRSLRQEGRIQTSLHYLILPLPIVTLFCCGQSGELSVAWGQTGLIKPGLRKAQRKLSSASGENAMCRCSRLSLQGPKDINSTKSGTSGAHVSPCKLTSGLEGCAGKTTRRKKITGSSLAAYVSRVGRLGGRRRKGQKGIYSFFFF